MNIGIIGVGEHSQQSHLKFLAGVENTNIVALADLDRTKMRKVNKKFNLDAVQTTEWERITRDDNVEAVFIMTPDRFHTAQLMTAVAMGKHVFCEKPLADNSADYRVVDHALNEAAENNLVVSSCHPRRFDPPYVNTKHLIEDPALLGQAFNTDQPIDMGRPLGFDFTFRYHKPSKVGLHESLMFDHMNHEIDLANYLFGVSGLQKAVKLHDSATRYSVSGIRNDGIELTFRGSRDLDSRVYQEDMRINFERGALMVDAHQGTASLDYEDMPTKRLQSPALKTDYDGRFLLTNLNFLQSIRGERPYLTADELRINTMAAIALHASEEMVRIN